jgi:hypothetical protein
MKSFTKITKKEYNPLWIMSGFTTYTEDYIKIRSRSDYKADTCIKCNHKFEINESIALAAFKSIGNKVICEPCAKELS